MFVNNIEQLFVGDSPLNPEKKKDKVKKYSSKFLNKDIQKMQKRSFFEKKHYLFCSNIYQPKNLQKHSAIKIHRTKKKNENKKFVLIISVKSDLSNLQFRSKT